MFTSSFLMTTEERIAIYESTPVRDMQELNFFLDQAQLSPDHNAMYFHKNKPAMVNFVDMPQKYVHNSSVIVIVIKNELPVINKFDAIKWRPINRYHNHSSKHIYYNFSNPSKEYTHLELKFNKFLCTTS